MFGENWYITGCILALILEIVSYRVRKTQKSSNKSRNFEKVGIKFDSLTGTYREETNTFKLYWFRRKFRGLLGLILNILLSWITVAFRLYTYGKYFYNRANLPEKVKEVHYKLENGVLSEEQVKECLQELAILTSGEKIDFRTDEEILAEEEENELEFESMLGWTNIWLDKENSEYTISKRTDDRLSVFTRTYEYKINKFKIEQRLLEDKSEQVPDEYYEVKDGVVLASDIYERNLKNSRPREKERLDEKIEGLKEDIEWHEVSHYRVKYFILKLHRTDFDKHELKKFLRGEAENIKLCLQELNELLKGTSCNLVLNEEYDYYDIKVKEEESFTQKEFDALRGNAERIFEKHGFKWGYFQSYHKILDEITKLLEIA